MEKKETFRFGVMGAGNISNKFCDAAEKTEEVCVTAVAARSEERAREFAEKYEIHTYYGNYEEMLQKEFCLYGRKIHFAKDTAAVRTNVFIRCPIATIYFIYNLFRNMYAAGLFYHIVSVCRIFPAQAEIYTGLSRYRFCLCRIDTAFSV